MRTGHNELTEWEVDGEIYVNFGEMMTMMYGFGRFGVKELVRGGFE